MTNAGLNRRGFHARFRADILHALEPLLVAGHSFDPASGLGIEPCPSGGVILTATDRSFLAIVRDPEGYASGPARVWIPEELLRGVTPPKPVMGIYQGDEEELPVPEWAQPGDVVFYDIAAYVCPKMHHPGDAPEDSHLLASAMAEEGNVYRGGYRIFDTGPITWRTAVNRSRNPRPEHIQPHFDPRRFRLFDRLITMALERVPVDCPHAVSIEYGPPAEPNLARVMGFPDFVGVFMGMNVTVPDPLPAWVESSDLPAKKEASNVV